MLRHEFLATLNGSEEIIVAFTLGRIITAWSRGAEKAFGYSADEIIGGSIDVLIAESFRPEISLLMARLAKGQPIGLHDGARLTKAGTTIYVEFSATPLFEESGQVSGAIFIARDITARKATEEALQARLRQQATVAHLGQLALGATESTTLIEEAVTYVTQVLGVEFCKVLELLPDGSSLLLQAGVGWRDGLVGQETLSAAQGSQAAYSLASSAPVIVEDLRAETRFRGADLLLQHGVVSGMSVIIHGLDGPYGVLGAHTTRQRTFTEDDINFLQAIANILGEAIQHRKAQEDHEARMRAEAAVLEMQVSAHQRALVLETANRVALDILANRGGVEALRHIAEVARVLAGARYAALGVATPDGLALQEFIAVGMTPAQQAAIGSRPKGRGILGYLLSCTKPLRIDHLSGHPDSSGFPPNHPPMDSFLGVPIRRGESVLGSLYLTNKQGGNAFTEADEGAVSALASHAGIAIHNLHLLSSQRALVRSLITAQEEERRNIAHDLHDGLTQFVMAAHAHIEVSQRLQAQDKTDKAERELQQGLNYLKEAVLESRRMVSGLRTLVLDDLGIHDALEQLLREQKSKAGWSEAFLECDLASRRFDSPLETALYRVAQEALNNVRKHAVTQRVQMSLTSELDATKGEQLILTVRDWGQGFDIVQARNKSGHFGLHGMSERVSLLGGHLQLQSVVGEGTTIKARFPLMPAIHSL